MKKLFLSLLILTSGVISANAANRRIVVRNEISWEVMNIYAYNEAETVKPAGAWPGTAMTLIGNDGTYNWYEYFLDDSYDYTIIFNKDTEQAYNASFLSSYGDKVFFVGYWDSHANYSMADLTYKFVTTDGSEAVNLTGSDCLYSGTFNASELSEAVYYALAPSYALKDNENTVKYWSLVYRPNNKGEDFAINEFVNYTDGMTASDKVWKFSHVNATFDINFDVKNKTFSFSPYFEKSVASGDAYASFSFDKAVEIPSGVGVYSLTKSSDTSVKLNQENFSALAANQGVLISGGGKFYPATSTAGTPANNILASSGASGVSVTTADYILAGDGDELGFYHPSAAGTLGAYKAYIPASNFSGSSSKLSFVIDDATAINEVGDINSDNSYYTLQGVKVNNAQKGVFIHNGKKVVLK